MNVEEGDILDEAQTDHLLETKGSMIEADNQILLDDWLRAKSNVWNTLFGLINAITPDAWKPVVKGTTAQYEHIVASIHKGQAAVLGIMLRASGPAIRLTRASVAGAEGFPRPMGTAGDTQPKTG